MKTLYTVDAKMRSIQKATRQKKRKSVKKVTIRYHVIVTELDETFKRRRPNIAHLYVELSASGPAMRFAQLQRGAGSAFAVGHHVRLHPNPPRYRTHTDYARAKAEMKRCKEMLIRRGHAVNNVESTWVGEHVVYVFDLDPIGKDKLMMNRDGSRKRGYVYVGQSSNPLDVRIAQHRRDVTSRTGKDIGAKATKNRRFTLREQRTVFTAEHAEELEAQLARHYERRGFLVDAGHVTPRKLARKAAKGKALEG